MSRWCCREWLRCARLNGPGLQINPAGPTHSKYPFRFLAWDYKTGASVSAFSSEVEIDGDGNVADLGKKDRLIAIGTAIPSAPVIAILENGARIFIGVEGGIVSMPAIATPDMNRYYWHQMF